MKRDSELLEFPSTEDAEGKAPDFAAESKEPDAWINKELFRLLLKQKDYAEASDCLIWSVFD